MAARRNRDRAVGGNRVGNRPQSIRPTRAKQPHTFPHEFASHGAANPLFKTSVACLLVFQGGWAGRHHGSTKAVSDRAFRPCPRRASEHSPRVRRPTRRRAVGATESGSSRPGEFHPRASHRTVREPLSSYGSYHPATGLRPRSLQCSKSSSWRIPRLTSILLAFLFSAVASCASASPIAQAGD